MPDPNLTSLNVPSTDFDSGAQAPLNGRPGSPSLQPPGTPQVPGSDGFAEAFTPLLADYAPTPFPAERFASKTAPIYGALDLGTNNCRLIVVRPASRGFVILDTFSRIVRLGEGVSQTGALSRAAMDRALDALKICSEKMHRAGVNRSGLIATEACRAATNSAEFLHRVEAETGMELQVISREVEARLAVAGCASLLDRSSEWAMVFDIGGGSSELVWLDFTREARMAVNTPAERLRVLDSIAGWTSLPFGVVTLAERFGGRQVDAALYERMIESLMESLHAFDRKSDISRRIMGKRVSLLGTSGTVTTIAGVHLNLPYYSRSKVDGVWLQASDVRSVTRKLLNMGYEGRALEPCIGPDRADLVLAGCAILEAMLRVWPCKRLRVADRGLREGILTTLMAEDDEDAQSHPAPKLATAGLRFQS